MFGHLSGCRLASEPVAEFASCDIGLLLHLDGRATEIRALPEVVDDGAPDPDAGVAGKVAPSRSV